MTKDKCKCTTGKCTCEEPLKCDEKCSCGCQDNCECDDSCTCGCHDKDKKENRY